MVKKPYSTDQHRPQTLADGIAFKARLPSPLVLLSRVQHLLVRGSQLYQAMVYHTSKLRIGSVQFGRGNTFCLPLRAPASTTTTGFTPRPSSWPSGPAVHSPAPCPSMSESSYGGTSTHHGRGVIMSPPPFHITGRPSPTSSSRAGSRT